MSSTSIGSDINKPVSKKQVECNETTGGLGKWFAYAVIANLLWAGTAVAICGSGNISGSKTCDTTNAGTLGCAVSTSSDPNACRAPGDTDQCTCCGDGIVQGASEGCDDGNNANGDGCSENCTVETGFSCSGTAPSVCSRTCGNGIIDTGEACDNGALNSDTTPEACRTTCVRASCGDNVRDLTNGETCDGTDGGSDCSSASSGAADACRADCSCCGDGNLDPGEACDDGPFNSDTDANACRTTCVRASCGDNVADFGIGETCDGTDRGSDCSAASSSSPDACRADCSCCGDGNLDPSEECDNGPGNSDTAPDACRTTCVRASCGDNTVDDLFGNETCDGTSGGFDCSPAGSSAVDACRADCSCCGDGNLDPGEECDSGFLNSDTTPNACRTTCVKASCGDNTTDFPGETCDGTSGGFDCSPAGSSAADACRADCSCCGDGNLDPGEECDSGFLNSDTTPNACRTTCVKASCGDNTTDFPGETCDGTSGGFDCSPAGSSAADACRADCSCCGDGNLDPGEACDDGIGNSDTFPNACRTTCVLPFCGDGVKDPGEECDTGGLDTPACDGGDCTLPACGDGYVNAAALEECDDGNTAPGDGCSALCLIETLLSTSQKGSLLYYSGIELKLSPVVTSTAGFGFAATQDTFISIVNDSSIGVFVQWYFIEGDPPTAAVPAAPGVPAERAHRGWFGKDCSILMTGEESAHMSLSTGIGNFGTGATGCFPFSNLDPGSPPGRPDPDGPVGSRILRGYAVAWAINAAGEPVDHNHLSGHTTIVNYANHSAWEYNTYNFSCVANAPPVGGIPVKCGTDPLCTPPAPCVTELLMDGIEYDFAYDQLLFNFYAVGSYAFSRPTSIYNPLHYPPSPPPALPVTLDTDLTLYPVSADFRTSGSNLNGPVVTSAVFDIWDENENSRTGLSRCITCWDQQLLSAYSSTNDFDIHNIGTDMGKARIDGRQDDACEKAGSCCCTQKCQYTLADCSTLTTPVVPCAPHLGLPQTCGLFGCADPDCHPTDLVPDRDCSEDAALLGVSDKILTFGGAAAGITDAGMTLVGQGEQAAKLLAFQIRPSGTLVRDAELRTGQDISNKEIEDPEVTPVREPSRIQNRGLVPKE